MYAAQFVTRRFESTFALPRFVYRVFVTSQGFFTLYYRVYRPHRPSRMGPLRVSQKRINHHDGIGKGASGEAEQERRERKVKEDDGIGVDVDGQKYLGSKV